MKIFTLLIEMVKDLPDLAIWVVIMFYTYKVLVVGSIFGLIRFGIKSIRDVLVKPKRVTLGAGSAINEEVAKIKTNQKGILTFMSIIGSGAVGFFWYILKKIGGN